MSRGNKRKNNNTIKSNCGDTFMRGSPAQLITKYEVLANEAGLNGDASLQQSYMQQIEHFTRMLGV